MSEFNVGDYVINRFDIVSAMSMISGDYKFEFNGILGRVVKSDIDSNTCMVKFDRFTYNEFKNNLIIVKPEIEDL